MKEDGLIVALFMLIFIALLLFHLSIKGHEIYRYSLDTEVTIASLKNRWCQMNDELQMLRKENANLRRDVRRIRAGRVNQDDAE